MVDGQMPNFKDDSEIERVYDQNFDVYKSVDPLKESACFLNHEEIYFWLGLRKFSSDGNFVNLYDNETVMIKNFASGHKCIYMQGNRIYFLKTLQIHTFVCKSQHTADF